jgi:hypothetical protein
MEIIEENYCVCDCSFYFFCNFLLIFCNAWHHIQDYPERNVYFRSCISCFAFLCYYQEEIVKIKRWLC